MQDGSAVSKRMKGRGINENDSGFERLTDDDTNNAGRYNSTSGSDHHWQDPEASREATDHKTDQNGGPCQSNGTSGHGARPAVGKVQSDGNASTSRGGWPPARVGIRDRISCFTWTWFTMTMATGGMANVLHAIPYRSRWLEIIGVIVFLFNICLFLMNCVLTILRFKYNPSAFKASFRDQSESLFFPATIVSFATILTNITQYGIPNAGHWLHITMVVLFWIYITLALLGSSGVYLMLWSTQAFPLNAMTPIWIFPAYPLLLAAPFAGNLIEALPTVEESVNLHAMTITLGSIVVQGTGFMVSLMIYGAFIYRLMTQKLPKESLRPGIFVSVGPSGFTVAGIVHLGNNLDVKTFPGGVLAQNPNTGFFLKLIADLVGLWLWGLCIWFFIISVGSHYSLLSHRKDPEHRIAFAMNWYSFVFPNTALVTATIQIGKALGSNAIQIVGTVMAGILVVVWLTVFYMMLRALYQRKLLWPKDDS